jgi:hypothetical protein
MQTWKLTTLVWVAALGAAKAAELPNRKGAAPPAKASACTVDGAPGFLAPGTQTCVRVTGAVRFEAIKSGAAK